MRSYGSTNSIPLNNKLNINNEILPSIPPGCQNQKITGSFTLRVSLNYVNIMRQSTILRSRFWGMEGTGIIFQEVQPQTHILNLNIRSHIEGTTQYFKDMKVVCIEVLTAHRKERQGSLDKNKMNQTFKQIGWIFVNPQRYIINHIVNSFEENVSIIDMRKQKIGEAKVKFDISMYKKEELYLYPTEKVVKQTKNYPNQLVKKSSTDQLVEKNKANYQPIPNNNQFKEDHFDPRQKRQKSFDEEPKYEPIQSDRNKFYKTQEEDWMMPQFRRKGRAQKFLQEYNKNKPKHTQLSLIRDKYGYNHPSVQVMKLKYDEVKLLSNVSEDNIKEEPRINLLLKTIKPEAKVTIDSLTIYCEQKNTKVKTETKLILSVPEQNQKVEINHLYMLPNEPTDVLIFEIKEGKAQIEVKSLKKTDKIELRNKAGKRTAIIQFTTVSNKLLEENSDKIGREKNHFELVKPILPDSSGKKSKQKQNAYISIIGWDENKITLKNKNFGITQACKLLFQINDPLSDMIQVILQNSKKEAIYLQANLANIFKEQNYVIQGKVVKIVSSRGPLNQILSLLEKLEPQNIMQQKQKQQIQGKHTMDYLQLLKELTNIFEKLAQSQEVQCSELIETLTTSEKTSLPKLERLSKILKVDVTIFQKILNEFFKSNFANFLSMFQIYHKWNHKYRLAQRKLKKVIQINNDKSVLKTLKKLKKSSQVLFGAVPSDILLANLLKIQAQQSRPQDQADQPQNDIEYLSKLIVLLFERYFNRSIKFNELEQYLVSTKQQHFNLNMFLISKMTYQINAESEAFGELLSQDEWNFVNLYKIDKEFSGELGLAKLLLTSEEQPQISDSSVLLTHQEQGTRKNTENIDGYHIRTEQSKQPYEKPWQPQKRHTEQPELSNKSSIKEKKTIKIPVVVTKIDIPKDQTMNKLSFFSQNQRIVLTKDQMFFPKAILMSDQAMYGVEAETEKATYEGVFAATSQPQRIKLYLQAEPVGALYLFKDTKSKTEQSDIVFKLVSQKTHIKQQDIHIPFEQKQNDLSILNKGVNRAKTPQVRLTIVSIQPTNSDFKLKIASQHDDKVKLIRFPSQKVAILDNTDQGWKVSLIFDEDYEDIYVANQIGTNTYCFCKTSEQTVSYIAVIEIAEHKNVDKYLNTAKESLQKGVKEKKSPQQKRQTWRYQDKNLSPQEFLALTSQIKQNISLQNLLPSLKKDPSPIPVEPKKEQNEPDLTPIKQYKQDKQERPQEHEKQKLVSSQFSKSFWNKSLRQTRQLWQKTSMSGAGTKQKRKIHELNKDEIKNKMQIFNRQQQ